MDHTTLTHNVIAIGNPTKSTWCIQDKINTKLASSTILTKSKRPSVYAGLRAPIKRANPVASKTSSSACAMVAIAFIGNISRILRLPNQELRTTGSSTSGFKEKRSIDGLEGIRASELIRVKVS
jgi:hypothetical protein